MRIPKLRLVLNLRVSWVPLVLSHVIVVAGGSFSAALFYLVGRYKADDLTWKPFLITSALPIVTLAVAALLAAFGKGFQSARPKRILRAQCWTVLVACVVAGQAGMTVYLYHYFAERSRANAVVNAVERYRSTHGQYPEGLWDLNLPIGSPQPKRMGYAFDREMSPVLRYDQGRCRFIYQFSTGKWYRARR